MSKATVPAGFVDRDGFRSSERSTECLDAIEAVLLAWEGSPTLERESARQAACDVVAGLAGGDPGMAARGARGLAGLGEGRTPAGDDFLMGALHALWMWVPAERAAPLAGAMAEAAAPRTTTLSAQWLRAASRGEAIPAWRDLLAALAAGDRNSMEAPLARVAATGHSSGLASLAGFVAAWRSLSARSPG